MNKRGTGPLVTKAFTSPERKAAYWAKKNTPRTKPYRRQVENLQLANVLSRKMRGQND